MRAVVVSLSDILAEPGIPLTPDYWINREPGESFAHYKLRRKAGELYTEAASLKTRAEQLEEQARNLLAQRLSR